MTGSRIDYDKEAARKQFKAIAGDRVTVGGKPGTVLDVRPTIINWTTGAISIPYTIMLDKGGPNDVQSWLVSSKIDGFEVLTGEE